MTTPDDLDDRLQRLETRLDDIVDRLARIEGSLLQERSLAERLDYEERARRELGEQTSWLLEILGDARKEARWLQSQRDKGPGDAS